MTDSYAILSNLDKVFIEALCVHETFLRLGFKSKQIFVSSEPSWRPETALLKVEPGVDCFHVVLKAQDKEVIVAIGPTPYLNTWPKEWDAAVKEFNKISMDGISALYAKSIAYKTSLPLLQAMVLCGFIFPIQVN